MYNTAIVAVSIMSNEFELWKKAGVISFTDQSFPNSVRNRAGVILIYAPWCGHCKSFAQEYAHFAQMIAAINSKTGSKYYAGTVEGDKNTLLNHYFNVKGYPTIVLIGTDSKPVEYEGERTAQALFNVFRKYTSV